MELEYIQDAYTSKSFKVVSEAADVQLKSGKKRVTFDSQLFLDELFARAAKYARRQQSERADKSPSKGCKLYAGIDIVSYGASSAKMAFVCKERAHTTIDLIHNHVGNLRLLADYSRADVDFIEQFQLLLQAAFSCFGKRWYELSEYDVKRFKCARFCLVEVGQHPSLFFDEARYCRPEAVVSKFFESMLRCLGRDALRRLCVAIPSDFHTYQRLVLKRCLDGLGLANYIITIKSTALAMPFLAKVSSMLLFSLFHPLCNTASHGRRF